LRNNTASISGLMITTEALVSDMLAATASAGSPDMVGMM